jgi:capsular exopolysaccharide synthesis family protein
MPNAEVPTADPAQSLVLSGPQSLQQPLDPLNVPAQEIPYLLDYWIVIVKRRWAVLACLLIVFTTVAIGTLKKKPVYEGKVLIEINPEQPNVLNFQEVLQLTSVDIDSYRETQYKVLQSRTLAEHVIDGLKLNCYPEFYRNRFLFGLIERDPDKIPSASEPGPPDRSMNAYRNTVKHFIDNIDVTPVRHSNLVEVSFYSEDAELAARIANQLSSDYIDQNLQVKWDETIKASEWLSGQLVGLKAKLEKSDDALQSYARANSIIFVEEKQNLVNERLKELQEAYTKAQAERFQKESLYNFVQAGRVQDLPGVLDNRLVQDLSLRLAELQRDYAQMTATVKPEYPKAIALKKQIDTIQASLDRQKKSLSQNTIDSYRSALANERYLDQALEEQKKEVNDIAEKSIQYNILKREVDTNKQLYEGLLTRMKEATVSAGLKASNVRIVDTAQVPKAPVKPKVALNLAVGLVLGAAFGVGLAFLQEYLDKTLKTPDEVEGLLRLPSLGLLPSYFTDGAGKGNDKRLATVKHGSDGAIAPAVQTARAAIEAYRSLRTSILLSASPVPKILLITSAVPSEGKTTVTVNLGATLASLGSKVVIVDCDMRKPCCHRSTGVENNPGFVRCLTGHVELADAILPVPGVPNLSVIPCGPIPPNPAEVLSSPVTRELFIKLRSQFEYVLIDSPPLLSVSDSRILSTLTDAVVLVTRAYSTPYDVVRRARGLLYAAGARILGVALNSVDPHKGGYGYGYGYGYGHYYYQYGYGYGYGYGQDTNEDSAGQSES